LFFIIFINKIKFSLKILPLKKGEAEIQKLFNDKVRFLSSKTALSYFKF